MKNFSRPQVVVSKCLEFAACRYNGQVLSDRFVRRLREHVKFIPVCPEVEIGLGTPREPIRIVSRHGRKQLVQPATGADCSGAMERFSGRFLEALPPVDGFILKNRSPSCGLKDVKYYPSSEKSAAVARGPGFFAARVLEKFPLLAVEDEGRLTDARIRDHFLIKIFTLAAFRDLSKHPSMKALVRFHTEHKLLFMAYSQKEMRELGRVTANASGKSISELLRDYKDSIDRLLAQPARTGAHVNVLMHAFGYVSGKITSRERHHFLARLEKYREGKFPWIALTGLLRSWILRFETGYLEQQPYFEPYPEVLAEED